MLVRSQRIRFSCPEIGIANIEQEGSFVSNSFVLGTRNFELNCLTCDFVWIDIRTKALRFQINTEAALHMASQNSHDFALSHYTLAIVENIDGELGSTNGELPRK